MNKRIELDKIEPKAYQAMFGLEKYISDCTIEDSLKELIKIRASMVNRCAYCIQMHTLAAREHGESEQRLYALSAWQESPLFSELERAVLALTDEVTLIGEQGLTTETYQAAQSHLGDKVLAQCIIQIVTINAWNRIAIATKLEHAK